MLILQYLSVFFKFVKQCKRILLKAFIGTQNEITHLSRSKFSDMFLIEYCFKEGNKMLATLDQLVFYFDIQCANCKNVMKASHASIEDQKGNLYCGLCGKEVKVPDHEKLVEIAQALNSYVSNPINSQYITLKLNEKYKGPQDNFL